MKREFRRWATELRAEMVDGKKKIVGYAAVFNSLSEPMKIGRGTFRERVMPGAFDRCLQSNPDIRGLVNHEPAMILGRTKSGTMSVKADGRGLRYDIDPPDTSYANDLMVSMERGDIDQSSFGFYTVKDNWTEENGQQIRELIDVDCFDVSPVTFPAYSAASSCVEMQMEMRAMFPDGVPESLEKINGEPTIPQLSEKQIEEFKRAWAAGGSADRKSVVILESETNMRCRICGNAAGYEIGSFTKDLCQKCDKEESRKRQAESESREAKTKSVDGKDLTASDFAHVGDPKDPSTWKLPIHDAAHVRNALARFNQVQGLSKEEKDAAWKKILAAAKKFKIDVSEKNSKKLEGAESAKAARLILREFDPDGDGDDDEALIDALIDACRGCSAVCSTLNQALNSVFSGEPEYTNPMLQAFIAQAGVLTSDLKTAIAEATKEINEPAPTPELNSIRARYRELFVEK